MVVIGGSATLLYALTLFVPLSSSTVSGSISAQVYSCVIVYVIYQF